jgi:hypothetical protein
VKLNSPQLVRQQEFPNEGDVIIVGMGNAVPAGQQFVMSLADLPHHSLVPRWTALSLAGLIVLAGIWVAGRSKDDPALRDAERKRMIARREKLLSELVRLENDHRNGRGDRARYASRREDLVAALELLYGALDDPDDSTGVAA